jgi:uncharacterized protein YutE (UPF0331/DUF86 family)
MSPRRAPRSLGRLQAAFEDTLDALSRRFEQLEIAVSQFAPDLDEQALTVAWSSDDPAERNRADSVLASFEKTYMLLMDLVALSVKLARRIGAIDEESRSAPELLVNAGVISQDDLQALEKQREVRNKSQHIYVALSMSELRSAVLLQLETTPRAIQGIAGWVATFEDREDRSR